MTKMIHFTNSGEIDPIMWNTFGVSVKNSNSAIGQFGTGLKYAIAVLLRHGREIRIDSNGTTYVFELERKEIRGKVFEVILCNGEALPFTTHLGSHWELWQAYRELYSNCLDEQGRISKKPLFGAFSHDTVVSAELADINHNDVFLDPERIPIIISPYCDVYNGSSNYLFYKGVRVKEFTNCQSKYTYNIKGTLDLTEDRTVKYGWEMHKNIATAVSESRNKDVLNDIVLNCQEYWDDCIVFDQSMSPPNDIVIGFAKSVRRNGKRKQDHFMRWIVPHLGLDQYEAIEPTNLQTMAINKARDFCERIGYEIVHPVRITKDISGSILAVADVPSKKIFLSERVMTMGIKQLASTLLEEDLHLREGFQDCTYEMQTYLFDQIITMGEKLLQEVL